MEQKCRKCNRVLPLTTQYFYKQKANKSGFKYQCKECLGRKFNIHVDKSDVPDGHKRCARCKEIKPLSKEFFHISPKHKNSDGFKSTCKTCRSQKAKIYRQKYRPQILERERIDRKNNPKKYTKYSKKYYEKIKNTKEYKEKQKSWWDSYYDRHQDRLVEAQRERYKKDPEKYIKITKDYQATPRGQLSVKRNNHKRRMREKESLMWFKEKDWIKCIEHFNHECCYCGIHLENPTMEHFIPLSKGGEFSPKNILPACLSCNSSKHTNAFNEWYPRQEFYSRQREKKILKYLGYKDNKQQMALF